MIGAGFDENTLLFETPFFFSAFRADMVIFTPPNGFGRMPLTVMPKASLFTSGSEVSSSEYLRLCADEASSPKRENCNKMYNAAKRCSPGHER